MNIEQVNISAGPIYMQMRKRKFNVCIIRSSKERHVEGKKLKYQLPWRIWKGKYV